jgi:predicted nucleic acid-binding protein
LSVVLDSSVTLAWLYSEECTPAIEQVFTIVTTARAWVPGLWRLEIANSLLMAVRRKRIGAELREQSLADLSLLNIVSDPDTETFAWSATLQLADRHHLTIYDAAYLELALRLSLPLATLDRDLRAAAGAIGVPLLGIAA